MAFKEMCSAIDSLTFSKIRRDLFPVLTKSEAKSHFQLEQYKNAAKEYIHNLMVLTPEEKEYMDRFVKGEYNPELLFSNPEILLQIENHPMALWRCNAK